MISNNDVCGVCGTLLHEHGSVCAHSLDRVDLASESQDCLNSWSDFYISSNVVEHDSCDYGIDSQDRVANVNSRCSVDLADDVCVHFFER